MEQSDILQGKTALITGGAARLGASHRASSACRRRTGRDPLSPFCGPGEDTVRRAAGNQRAASATTVQGDLIDPASWPRLIEASVGFGGGLDVSDQQRVELLSHAGRQKRPRRSGTTCSAAMRAHHSFSHRPPQAQLRRRRGCIVNMVDIHAERPIADHPVYCMAKAANAMMVKALARDLAPEVRVNGIAPGAALWPEDYLSDEDKQEILRAYPHAAPCGGRSDRGGGDVHGDRTRLHHRSDPGGGRRAQRAAIVLMPHASACAIPECTQTRLRPARLAS